MTHPHPPIQQQIRGGQQTTPPDGFTKPPPPPAPAPPSGKPQTALDQAIDATTRRGSLTASAAERVGVPPGKLCHLLRQVWAAPKGQPALTDEELFAGISLIARFELDPIAREIHVTRGKDGRMMTIVGIDGIIKILDRTEHYDGFEQIHTTDEHGKVTAIETVIYSTRRKYPTRYKALAHEYAALAGFMHGKIPVHMLGIFSLRHAARMFTPLGANVVSEEEAKWMMHSAPADPGLAPTPPDTAATLAALTEPQLAAEPAVQEPAVQEVAVEADTTPDPVAVVETPADEPRRRRKSELPMREPGEEG